MPRPVQGLISVTYSDCDAPTDCQPRARRVARPQDYRRCEPELDPGPIFLARTTGCMSIEGMNAETISASNGCGERDADPKPPRHIGEFWICVFSGPLLEVPVPCANRAWSQVHRARLRMQFGQCIFRLSFRTSPALVMVMRSIILRYFSGESGLAASLGCRSEKWRPYSNLAATFRWIDLHSQTDRTLNRFALRGWGQVHSYDLHLDCESLAFRRQNLINRENLP